MQQYLVTAWDGKDEDALARRMKARPAHFDGARLLKESSHFIAGGAMLDEDGRMIGSTMIVQFENENELQLWLKTEPYITGNVWKEITVYPFRLANV